MLRLYLCRNLLHLPAPLIDLVRRALRGETFVPVAERLEVMGSRPHGHVQAVRLAMQRLKIESLLGSRPSPERERVLVLIAARVLAPNTKLATTRWWHSSTLAEEFGMSGADACPAGLCVAGTAGRGLVHWFESMPLVPG